MEPEPRLADVTFQDTPCRSALNPVRGMGFDWSLNPYMGCEHRCAFCYVRAFELRADRPADDRYGRTVRVKTNIAQVLRRELSRPRWPGGTIAIGAATDPYQPAEGRYRLTRACLEVLRDFANPTGLITRGPMIVRDIDVLSELAARAELHVNFSIPTLDDRIWRLTEPGTAHPRQRLRAIEKLSRAGIRTGVGMAPILPGLSDRADLLEDVVRAARDAGADSIWANVLYLREGTREHFMTVLERHWPEMVPRYQALYAGRAYLPRAAVSPSVDAVARMRARHFAGRPERAPRIIPRPALTPRPEQLALL